MSSILTIGVLGGMGPEATNRLCALITAVTPAVTDQEHIPVVTYNNSLIPERLGAIYGKSVSPLPELIRTAQVLEQAGAQLLVMPCNLAHHFIDELRASLRLPLLNMIEETVSFAVERYPHLHRVGLLASTPTLELGLYQNSFATHRRTVLVPAESEQQAKVMEAIYGQQGLKSGYRIEPRALLLEAAQHLLAQGAELIVAGCSEVSLVLETGRTPFVVIDPLEVIARVAVERALAGDHRRVPEDKAHAARRSNG